MFISGISFYNKNSKYAFVKNQDKPTFKGLETKVVKEVVKNGEHNAVAEVGKKVMARLLSLSAFAKMYKMQPYMVRDAIANDEIDVQGKKIDTLGDKTQKFLACFKNYVSVKKFIEMCKVHNRLILRAIANNEIQLHGKKVDMNSPKTQDFYKECLKKFHTKDESLTRLGKAGVARLLGIDLSGVTWHIKKGKLVQNEDGSIDITKEPNKSFVENFKAKVIKKKYPSEDSERYWDVLRMAGKLGISRIGVIWHIKEGNIVKTDKGIDMEDPINIEFMKNYTKRKYARTGVSKLKPQRLNVKTKEVNFNHINLSELAAMLCLSENGFTYYLDRGQVVRTEEKLFDLDNPVNKVFIEKQKSNTLKRLQTASGAEILDDVKALKRLISKRIGNKTFVNAQALRDDEKEYAGYLEYSLKNIVDVTELTEIQYNELLKIFQEIVEESIADGSGFRRMNLESKTKLSLNTFSYLLDVLSKKDYASLTSETVDSPVTTRKNDKTNAELKQISFNKYIQVVKKIYSEKFKILKTLEDVKTKELVDRYLYNRYVVARNKMNVTELEEKLSVSNLIDNLDETKVMTIVEKVLMKSHDKQGVLYKDYKKWKSEQNVEELESFIHRCLELYRGNIYKGLYSERGYLMMQEANPEREISKEDFRKFINKEMQS